MREGEPDGPDVVRFPPSLDELLAEQDPLDDRPSPAELASAYCLSGRAARRIVLFRSAEFPGCLVVADGSKGLARSLGLPGREPLPPDVEPDPFLMPHEWRPFLERAIAAGVDVEVLASWPPLA